MMDSLAKSLHGSLALVQQARQEGSGSQPSGQVPSVLMLAGDVMAELGHWLGDLAARAPTAPGGPHVYVDIELAWAAWACPIVSPGLVSPLLSVPSLGQPS